MSEINIPGFQASQIFVTMQDGTFFSSFLSLFPPPTSPSLQNTDNKKKTALKSQGSTLSQSAKGIFQFDIKSKDNKTQTWYADLKGPAFGVTTGAAPGKPDVTMTLSDEDLIDLASGKITG